MLRVRNSGGTPISPIREKRGKGYGMNRGPLEGIRVLEVTQIVAGPFTGVNLADLGAEVVKVEPSEGDGVRRVGGFMPGESKAFHTLNRGKRGIAMDLQRPEAKALMHRIISAYDVFIINSRAGVAKRLELDYETLTQYRSDLIYLENTGYGSVGPSATRSGSDVVAQAYSGLMAAEAKVDEYGAPLPIACTAVADYGTGFAAAMAVCAALYRRQLSGQGEFISTSLLMTALSMQAITVSRLPVSDELLMRPLIDAIQDVRDHDGSYADLAEARRNLRYLAGKAFLMYYGGYPVKDGAVIVGALTPANQQQFREVWGITDDPSASPDFNALDPVMDAKVDEVSERIRALMLTKTMDEWMEEFDRVGAPASKVNMPENMADDPQVRAIDALIPLEHPLTGTEELVGPVVKMRNMPNGSDRPAPPLGYHTDEVLAEHGLGASEIADLRQAGVLV